MEKSRSIYSSRTRRALNVLAGMIAAARKERNMSQAEMAERLGVSLPTVIAIEKGGPKVAVGTVFEAAAIVGIPLVAENSGELEKMAKSIAAITQVLPRRSGRKRVSVDDDF